MTGMASTFSSEISLGDPFNLDDSKAATANSTFRYSQYAPNSTMLLLYAQIPCRRTTYDMRFLPQAMKAI